MAALERWLSLAVRTGIMSKAEARELAEREAMAATRAGARKILRDYESPPLNGTLVPRAWAEQHMSELREAAEL
jgi:hypothetical protein